MAAFDFSIKPVETLRNDLDRLTILRMLPDTPPVFNLVNLMNDLLSEDAMPFDIRWAYHDFAAAVLSSEAAGVTGDRWRDFLIEAVLERENAFSLAAAHGRLDDALTRAWARDLSIVQTLFLLDDAMVRNWCSISQHGADLSGWASFSTASFYIVEGEGPLPTMRRMLLSSEDWSLLAAPLGELHAQFGAGAMLGCRYMDFTPDGLVAIERVNPPGGERNGEIDAAVAAFCEGGAPRPLLVTGQSASGLIRAAVSGCSAHIVRLGDASLYPMLCERLADIRTRFIALIPAPHPMEPLLSDIVGEGLAEPPQNIMPIMYTRYNDPMLTSLCTHIQV